MKLKKYLLIALLPVIIGAVLITYYFYLRTEEKAFGLVIDTKRVTLEQVANSITTQFHFMHYDLQDLSQREAIIDISNDGKKEIDLFYETHSSIFVSLTRKALEEDIKKRKETENELIIAKEKAEASDRLKSEFLAQVSHEIRTPINTILSISSLIGDELSAKVSDDLKEGFGIMAIAGQRIIRTIDLILNMSELQTQTYDPRKTKFNLIDDILTPLVEEFQIHAGTKKLKLELVTSLDKSKAIIKKDRYSISQIFINLVDNAIKYTLKGGIKINVYLNTNNKLCVEVSDTGIGIAEEYLPVLFDSFSQEEQGYSRRFEGTGLGLALVKNYCEINDAEIEVKSSKGAGSTFRAIFN